MKKTIMLAALACIVSMPALANEAKMDAKADKWFAKMDTNGDGKISKEEHSAFGDDKFAKADTDGDGYLSKAELKAEKAKDKTAMKSQTHGTGQETTPGTTPGIEKDTTK